MAHYIHHVPGRIRIKSPLLKIQENQDRVKSTLARWDGIQSVETNATTGSVTVLYDGERIHSEELIRLFQNLGYFDRSLAIDNDQYIQRLVTQTGHVIKKALFGSAFEAFFAGTPLSYLSLFI